MPKLRRIITQVSRRLSAIDRKLGMLEATVHFRALHTLDWEDVSIFAFEDNGVDERKLQTGESIAAHRYTVQVDRDWLKAHQGIRGEWSVLRFDDDEARLPCEHESEVMQDNSPYATVVLRVAENINYDLSL